MTIQIDDMIRIYTYLRGITRNFGYWDDRVFVDTVTTIGELAGVPGPPGQPGAPGSPGIDAPSRVFEALDRMPDWQQEVLARKDVVNYLYCLSKLVGNLGRAQDVTLANPISVAGLRVAAKQLDWHHSSYRTTFLHCLFTFRKIEAAGRPVLIR